MHLLPAFTGMPQENNVYNVDALTLLKAIPDNTVDLIVTSPPYDNLRTYNGYSFDFESIAHESYRVLKQGGVLVWVVGDSVVNGSETLTSFCQALFFVNSCGFRMHDTMIWRKVTPGNMHKRYNHSFEYMFVLSKGEPDTFNGQMRRNKRAGVTSGGGTRTKEGYSPKSSIVAEFGLFENVWDVAAGNNGDDRTGHPAVFAEELAERHILTWSNPGDLGLDYFGGSGTTAKMALHNGREFLTSDISPEYCELMRKRLAQPYTLPMFTEASA
jgi:DNA modification methylase